MSGSGISWAICKSAPRSRQITMPPNHHSVFYRLDALPATQPTASKHWRQILTNKTVQENTDKQTQYKSEKVNNLKYSRTKLPWFSCLLQHSARKWGGLILQCSRARAHTGHNRFSNSSQLWPTDTETMPQLQQQTSMHCIYAMRPNNNRPTSCYSIACPSTSYSLWITDRSTTGFSLSTMH